jgi:hypothetical protein
MLAIDCCLSGPILLRAPFVTEVGCVPVLVLDFPVATLGHSSTTAVLLLGQDDMFSNSG